MLNKLLSLYPNAVHYKTMPEEFLLDYHWFQEKDSSSWLRIPKNDLHMKELEILKTLFAYRELVEFNPKNAETKQWQSFLFQGGTVPENNLNSVRIIQFECSDKNCDHNELQASMFGFFSETALFLWLSNSNGLIIEEKSQIWFSEEDFLSISNTFESDLFVKVYFYLGKFQSVTKELRDIFQYEQNLFKLGLQVLSKERIFTFEKLLPIALLGDLSHNLKLGLTKEIQGVFSEDPDMLMTIKVFLENNSNVSLTAKKLYIHRNTLQYRIDKFIEKTGVNLKTFHGAVTAYLACLNEENNKLS